MNDHEILQILQKRELSEHLTELDRGHAEVSGDFPILPMERHIGSSLVSAFILSPFNEELNMQITNGPLLDSNILAVPWVHGVMTFLYGN